MHNNQAEFRKRGARDKRKRKRRRVQRDLGAERRRTVVAGLGGLAAGAGVGALIGTGLYLKRALRTIPAQQSLIERHFRGRAMQELEKLRDLAQQQKQKLILEPRGGANPLRDLAREKGFALKQEMDATQKQLRRTNLNELKAYAGKYATGLAPVGAVAGLGYLASRRGAEARRRKFRAAGMRYSN